MDLNWCNVQALLLLAILLAGHTPSCRGIAYEAVKSPLYPHLPAGIKAFRDDPGHGPIVAVQLWYSDKRIFGFRSTFLDKYRSPVHGYAVGNSSTISFDPENNDFLTLPGIKFGSIAPDGSVGGTGIGFVRGNLSATVVEFQSVANVPLRPEEEGRVTRIFGDRPELESVGYAPPGLVVGLRGSADKTGITQLGVVIEARPLSFAQSATGHRLLEYWPKEAVVRSLQIPRLPAGLQPFDDGVSLEHGQIVEVELWVSESQFISGIRSTYEDGFRTPVHGYTLGQTFTLKYDAERDPLVAVGARGGSFPSLEGEPDGEYRLGALAFYGGGTRPPTRSATIGNPQIRTYSDSAGGKIVGLFGQLSKRYAGIIQLGVHVIGLTSSIVVSSGPFPAVNPFATVPFDHTGDNAGVSRIDVYYDNYIGVRGLRFTYVTRLGFKYTTPVYGKKLGLHNQVQFDYVNNPLVNVGIYVGNVLAGTGEIGLLGLTFHTQRGDFIGTFGVFEYYFNLTDGTKRVVGFHGQANTVMNALGVYTAPL